MVATDKLVCKMLPSLNMLTEVVLRRSQMNSDYRQDD
jgi:hypothetical protein